MSHKQRILLALAETKHFVFESQWIHFSTLNKVCYRYSARIFELRRERIDIAKKQIDGAWCYKLMTDVEKIDFDKCELKPFPERMALMHGAPGTLDADRAWSEAKTNQRKLEL